jgi:ABC-type uncharacterized transport system involved in gliding motility auxiliary subunit
MPETAYQRYAPWALVLGLVGLAAAAVVWILQQQFNTAVQAALAVGLLGLALALLLNPGAVQTWLGGRQARYGGNVLLMALAMIGIVALVNYIAYTNPQRWDWSEDQRNTLAPETLEVLRDLPQPARAVGFYSSSFATSQSSAQRLLERYQVEAPGRFTFEFFDPLGDPVRAREYNITRDGTLIIEMGGQREEISFASEEQITGALIRLANPGSRVIYFLTGHGEPEIESSGEASLFTVADLLRKQNYELRTLNLQVTTTVPSDARAIVIVGPLVPVTEQEVDVIRQYAGAGGSLVVMLDPTIQTQAGPEAPEPLVDYLQEAWAVRVANDVVVDLYNSYPNQPLFPLSGRYGASEVTNRLQGIATVFPVARSVHVPEPGAGPAHLSHTPLVTADSQAWGETDFDSLSSQSGPTQTADDNPPPLHIGVAIQNMDTGARLVVYGDSDFASDTFANQGANANLFANSVNWATVEESLINLTPRVPATRTMALTDVTSVRTIFLVTVVLMPLMVVALGAIVWYQRRRHV